MAFLVTMLRRDCGASREDRPSSFEVASEIEAVRIAQEGTMIAGRRGEHVTYEVHDRNGRLVVLWTSAAVET